MRQPSHFRAPSGRVGLGPFAASLVLGLALLAAPGRASAADPAPAAITATAATPSHARRAATHAELDAYAARAEQGKTLEEFEGGRGGGGVTATTVIVILLVVIVIVLLV